MPSLLLTHTADLMIQRVAERDLAIDVNGQAVRRRKNGVASVVLCAGRGRRTQVGGPPCTAAADPLHPANEQADVAMAPLALGCGTESGGRASRPDSSVQSLSTLALRA